MPSGIRLVYGVGWLTDPSYRVPGQSDYCRDIWAPSHGGRRVRDPIGRSF